MNNEEKILSILETMNDRLGNLEAGQAKLETGQAELRADHDNLLRSVVVLENTTTKQVQLLTEGHALILEKLDRIIGEPPIEERVDNLEYTVSLHDDALKRLLQDKT
jgi:hypothetical protein